MVILEFKEKLAQEGFLVFLAYQVPADHLDLRGTEDCLVILDLRGWEWKDHQDPQDLMELLDHLELENQDHKDLEDLQEKVVVVACQEDLALLDRQATVSFVKHSKCKQTEAPQRKDKCMSMDNCQACLTMDLTCSKNLITAEVVTRLSCQWRPTLLLLYVIIVTTELFCFTSNQLCTVHLSSSSI